MPKFAETMTEEQRAAVVAEALALGNRKEAWRRAKAGTMTAQLEPFEISYTYLCELVQAEEERRDPAGVAARGKTAAELADDILRRELRRLDSASRGNRLNAEKAKAIVPVLRQLEAIARKAPAPPAGGDQGADVDAADTPAQVGILDRLVAEEEHATSRPEHPDDVGDGNDGSTGDDSATDGSTIERATAEQATTPVRGHDTNSHDVGTSV